ncbi:hypothetical protein Bca101_067348 [Brassica carinata]
MSFLQAIKVLNMIKLHGKSIHVNKASQDTESLDVAANLFIGNLDHDVDEKTLYHTFSAFGFSFQIMRHHDSMNSCGFSFISNGSFDAFHAATEEFVSCSDETKEKMRASMNKFGLYLSSQIPKKKTSIGYGGFSLSVAAKEEERFHLLIRSKLPRTNKEMVFHQKLISIKN